MCSSAGTSLAVRGGEAPARARGSSPEVRGSGAPTDENPLHSQSLASRLGGHDGAGGMGGTLTPPPSAGQGCPLGYGPDGGPRAERRLMKTAAYPPSVSQEAFSIRVSFPSSSR